MKLPYRAKVLIPQEKLTRYLLLPTQPKSVFFRGIGFDESSIKELEQEFYTIAQKYNVKNYKPSTNNSGINYEIRGALRAPDGIIHQVITIWFIKTGTKYARFITAYPV